MFSRVSTSKALICAALLVGAFTTSANAAVYSNTRDYSDIFWFGADDDTTSYGQVFDTSTGILTDWSFFILSGNQGNLSLVIADWDGTKAVGPALYSNTIFYAGGYQELSFSNINTHLTTGSYIGYLTVANVTDPVSNGYFAGSTSDGGLSGSFRYSHSYGVDPLTMDSDWSGYWVPNMQFSATITAATVPEPENLAMLMAGLGLLSIAVRRNKQA